MTTGDRDQFRNLTWNTRSNEHRHPCLIHSALVCLSCLTGGWDYGRTHMRRSQSFLSAFEAQSLVHLTSVIWRSVPCLHLAQMEEAGLGEVNWARAQYASVWSLTVPEHRTQTLWSPLFTTLENIWVNNGSIFASRSVWLHPKQLLRSHNVKAGMNSARFFHIEVASWWQTCTRAWNTARAGQ